MGWIRQELSDQRRRLEPDPGNTVDVDQNPEAVRAARLTLPGDHSHDCCAWRKPATFDKREQAVHHLSHVDPVEFEAMPEPKIFDKGSEFGSRTSEPAEVKLCLDLPILRHMAVRPLQFPHVIDQKLATL